ncbi:YodC family protein [Xanthobacter sp. ZOL 2024]
MAFNAGDIVQLKSGSPALTVVEVIGADVKLVWYADEVGEFRNETLPEAALEILDLTDFEDEEEDGETEAEADED